MSSLVDTLDAIRRSGGKVWVDGGEVRVRARRGVVTEELRATLAAHKAVLVALFGDEEREAIRWVESLDHAEGAAVVQAAGDGWQGIVGKPAPCPRCACCIGWETASGRVACCQCEPKPTTSAKLLLVEEVDGLRWVDYAAERQRHERRHEQPVEQAVEGDSWESAIEWNDSTPRCSDCGSCAGRVDSLDRWRCWRCEPPRKAQRLLDDRKQVLAKAIRAARRYAARPKPPAARTTTPPTPPPGPPRWRNEFNPEIGF